MSPQFKHKKSLGQHFLTSDIVPGWLCDAAAVGEGDTVLEIGPGTGILTAELLARGARVIALETDERALNVLAETFADAIKNDRLTLTKCDVRNLDLATIPGLSDQQFKIVANIPYYLSGHLFRSCLQNPCQPSDLVFLVQKEVAKRVCTRHEQGEKHSLLSLSVQVYGDVSYVRTVSRGHFHPAPAVDSGIVAVRNISRHNFETVDEAAFFHLLHLGFAQKRKQLLGNLAAAYDRDQLITTFSTLDLSPTVRAEDVAISTWLKLAQTLTAA